jgi:hypothetical protein
MEVRDMLQYPPLSLPVMTKQLSPDNLAILGTHYIKKFLMKRGKRENIMGNPPQKRGKKNVEWPKVTYSVVSTTPSITLSSENFFSVKDLVKMSANSECEFGYEPSEIYKFMGIKGSMASMA